MVQARFTPEPVVKKLRLHVQVPEPAPAAVLLLFGGQGRQVIEAPLPGAWYVFAGQAQADAPGAEMEPPEHEAHSVEFAAAA